MSDRRANTLKIAIASAAGLALLVGGLWTPGRAASSIGTGLRSLQSLSKRGESNWLRYLSLDENTGVVRLRDTLDQTESGGYWEVKRKFYKHRGYHAYLLRNRGNSRFNGYLLGVDPASGAPRLQRSESTLDHTTSWSIRYAGKHNGCDAYFVQNLGRSRAGVDMAFLSVDPTGGFQLQSDPGSGSHWMLRRTPGLPSEVIR